MNEWTGGEFFDGVRAQVTEGVGNSANVLADKMREEIGTAGPPRSSPGEPPHVDSGALLASIQVVGPVVSGDLAAASAGTDIDYGVMLEFGTSRMAARPWMARALYDNKTEIGQAATGK